MIDVVDQQLRLPLDVAVDLREAEALARRALDNDAGEHVDPSVLAHDLLPDWYDDWLLVERECFRQSRLRALDALCDRLTRADRLREALQAGLSSIAAEPLRESAHRALIRVHLADGNAVEAIRQYRFYQRLLTERLGLEPSDRMKELMRRVHGPQADW